MDGTLTLAVLVGLHSALCSHVFFHEPSAILVTPDTIISNTSDFGFAIGLWNKSLIVSSPSFDLYGKVYRCPLAAISNNSLGCSSLDLFKSNTFSRDINPTQHFYLGASIAATNDYLFTCAPLVTKNIRRSTDVKIYPDAIGSCFIYSNDTSNEYRGPEARFIRGDDANLERIQGGTGWNTLADEENGFLIVAKTSVFGDINYLSISDPLNKPDALTAVEMKMLGDDVLDVGYGITAGKFFSHDTVYAFSKQSKALTGQIVFLEEVKNTRSKQRTKVMKLKLMLRGRRNVHMIRNEKVGAMFGYALGAADLNSDGLSELLVGAPLQSEDKNDVEFGALHIYLGGDIKYLNNGNRMRSIFGAKEMGRFGTTIASSDIDGDNIPEIFVSAPYEDSGVVYILSGVELKNTLLTATSSLTMQVTKMQHLQKVIRRDLALGFSADLLGFSLLTIPDIDGNGCNELAIGAPGANSVLLFRCLQTINVTVTSKLVGESVRELEDSCAVRVCLKIGYNTKANNISGHISVNNYIDGYATISKPSFKVDLSKRHETFCEDILVKFLRHEMYDYKLRTKLELENTKTLESQEFDASWSQLSINSETNYNLTIPRRCSDDDCNPDLSLVIMWNPTGATHVSETKGKKNEMSYVVESSEEETISVLVKNKGFQTSEGCVWIEITGAPVYKPGKCSPKPPQDPRGYECTLPTSFRRGDETTFDMLLNMSRLSNANKALVITARPHENCNQKVSNVGRDRTLKIYYWFKEAWSKVRLEGVKEEFVITDLDISEVELENNNEQKDTKENMENKFKNQQRYSIINNGSVLWNRSIAVIEVEKRQFITEVDTSKENNCSVSEVENHYTITCPVGLRPNEIKTIIAWAKISRKEVGKFLNGGQRINVTSHMTLFMDYPLEKAEFIQKSLVTDIIMQKDISFKNNKMLIGLIAAILALLLLALVTYCLFKNGFFKRKEKKKLAVLRESVRRHSIRLASVRSSRPSQKSPSNDEDDNDIDIEVVEDSPFEEVPISTKDNAELIKAQAEVHQEKNKNEEKGPQKTT